MNSNQPKIPTELATQDVKVRKFDRDYFYNVLRVYERLTQKQVDALNLLLDFMEEDVNVKDLNHFAYMLATVKHETASTYRPIEEYGKGKGKKYGIPDKNGNIYYGRGYVQLTWDFNYKKMSDLLNIDFYNKPELVLDYKFSYKIMSYGMRLGLFTGVKLYDFINKQECNFRMARKIINGLDRASTIAQYAEIFKKALRLK